MNRPAWIIARAAVTAAALGAVGWCGVGRADTVVLANGTRYSDVQVVSARWDQIQYKPANVAVATSLDGAKVLEIEREAAVLDRPRKAIASGDYALAIKDLEAFAETAGDWRTAEAKYLLGLARRRSGDLKGAVEAFKTFLEKHKAEKDWLLPFATYELGNTLLELKQPGTAEGTFKLLDEYKGQWTSLAKIGQAEAILQREGKAGAMKSRGLLDEVARDRSLSVNLRQKALLGRARVLFLQENAQGVIQELTEGFFSPSRAETIEYSPQRAEATLYMGRAYAALGGKQNLEEAEIWLLRVAALYRKDYAVYASACDALTEVYGKLGNTARAEEWKRRKQAATPARG